MKPMRLRPFAWLAPALALSLGLAACAPPAPPLRPVDEASLSRAARALGTITGVVRLPASIVSNNGGSVIGEHGASIVGDAGAGVISLNKRVVLALDEGIAPGAEVVVTDAAGAPLAGVPTVKADGEGRYTLKGVPAGPTMVVRATWSAADGKPVSVITLAATTTQGVKADVGVATTFAATSLLAGRSSGLGRLDRTAYEGLVAVITGKLVAADTGLLGDAAAIARRVKEMLAQDATAGAAAKAVEQALGEELVDNDALAALAAPASPAPGGKPPAPSKTATPKPDADAKATPAPSAAPVVKATPGPSAAPVATATPVPRLTEQATFPVGASGPTAITFDKAGDAWVRATNKLVKLGPAGEARGTFTLSSAGGLLCPDPAGGVWYVDGSDLRHFAADGTAGPALKTRVGTVCGGAVVGPDGHLWLASRGGSVLYEHGTDGAELAEHPVGGNWPVDPVFDAAGNIWVGGNFAKQLFKLTSRGEKLATYTVEHDVEHLAFAGDGSLWVGMETSDVSRRGSEGESLGPAFPVQHTHGLFPAAGGDVWAVGTSLVALYAPDGSLRANFSGLSAIEGATAGPDGRLWVVTRNDGVHVLSR